MDLSDKKQLAQSDWDDLRKWVYTEAQAQKTIDLGSILDRKGFSRQIRNFHFCKLNFQNFNLDHLEFHDCNFSECDFRNASLSHLQFIQCDCTKAKWLDSTLTTISFNACNFSCCEIIHSEFQNISIEASILSGSYWNHVQLVRLQISSSVLSESVFYASSINDSSMSGADLQDVFWIQNSGEFLKANCTSVSTNRPVIGMAWDFLQRGSFSPYIDDVLRDNNAVVLKIEMQSKSVDVDTLNEEVAESLRNCSESAQSIARKLFRSMMLNSEIDKIKGHVSTLLDYCNALALPGGNNIEPEFYTNDEQSDLVHRDYRRSIVEFALLAQAHNRKMPIIGICRGAQMINVYFGGTIRELPEIELGWQHLCLSNSSKKEEFQSWIGGTNIWAFSMHKQACDKIGDNLEIIIEREGVPKLLISYDNQFIAVQFHPEAYLLQESIGGCPESIHNKGIYQLFFLKVLQYQMSGV